MWVFVVPIENINNLKVKINKAIELNQMEYNILSKNAFDLGAEFYNNKKFINQNNLLFE